MSRNKFLIGGIILAILAGVAVTVLLAFALPSQEVVKISSEVQPGDSLKGHLYLDSMPKKAVPPGAFESMDGLENMYSIATLYKGDILRKPHVSETITEGGTLSARLEGMKLGNKVGFALDKEATTGLKLEIGDKLRVCAVSEYYANPANSDAVTQTGQAVSQPTIIVPSATVIYIPSIGTDGKEESDSCVVVALSEDEFLKLSQAKEIGKLYAAVLPIGGKE